MNRTDTEPVRADELVDAELDRHTIAHLDFALVCHLRMVILALMPGGPVVLTKGPACTEPAVAVMQCKVCRHETFVCAQHRAQVASDPGAFCPFCSTRAHGSVLFDFRALDGAS